MRSKPLAAFYQPLFKLMGILDSPYFLLSPGHYRTCFLRLSKELRNCFISPKSLIPYMIDFGYLSVH